MTEQELIQKGYKQTKDNNLWICTKTSKQDNNNIILSLSLYYASENEKSIEIETKLRGEQG